MGFRRLGLILGVFFAIWGAKLITIDRYGSDLPYWDQWAKEGELFYAPWFEHHEFWQRIFVPHNEHRIAPTLALNLGLLRLGGDQWDARVQCVVSGALHALLMVGLFGWALRRLERPWAITTAFLLVIITAPPIAWENVLGGFQSQFYFLAIFSLLAIAGLLQKRAFSVGWVGGIISAALASVSMGSGMLVAAPVAALALIRLRSRETRRDALPTLIVAILIGAVGLWFRPQAPWHAQIHAHFVGQYLGYFTRCLAWPLYGTPWLALVFWLPSLVLAVQRFRHPPFARPMDASVDLILASSLWVLVQVAAVSYSRAGGSDLPAPRYGDVFALGLLFNFFALIQLIGLKRARKKAVAVAWFAVVALCVAVATRAVIRDDLPRKKTESVEFERNVQAFVLTDDYTTFEKQKLPFPLPDWLARMLRNPTLRRLLPSSVREPVQVKGLGDGTPLSPNADLPPLAHRQTRVVTTASEWRSEALPSHGGWWKIETSGAVGTNDASLRLESASTGHTLAEIKPTKPAGASWRAAYIPAPVEPAKFVARASGSHWLGFSEPVEMSSLSYRTWRLAQHGAWLAIAGGALLTGVTLASVGARSKR